MSDRQHQADDVVEAHRRSTNFLDQAEQREDRHRQHDEHQHTHVGSVSLKSGGCSGVGRDGHRRALRVKEPTPQAMPVQERSSVP